MQYIKKNLHDIKKNQLNRVQGSNYYTRFHDSDMHNEETDLSKYFEIEQSVPDTNNALQQLKCNDDISQCKDTIKPVIDHQTGNPTYFDQGSDGTLTHMPDWWRYKNEKPMNGGRVDGVRGIDDEAGTFALYPPVHQQQPPAHVSSYPYIQSAGQW